MFNSIMYRAARYLYSRSRVEFPNNPQSNGEYWLLQQVMNRTKGHAMFMDIGANKGNWTQKVLELSHQKGIDIRVSAFEPSGYTRSLLKNRFDGNNAVQVYDCALSSHPGTSSFYIGEDGAGTNSLSSESGNRAETVAVSTIDNFLTKQNEDHVSFIKIDTEGFDALVLEGGKASLEAEKIDMIQFEYNWRWLLNSKSLRDVFNIIEGLPYQLGKLAGNKLLVFDEWHFEMDRYFEGNYALIRKGGIFDNIGINAWYDRSNALCYRV